MLLCAFGNASINNSIYHLCLSYMPTRTKEQRAVRLFDSKDHTVNAISLSFWIKFAAAIITFGLCIAYFAYNHSNIQNMPSYAIMASMQAEQSKKYHHLEARIDNIDLRVAQLEKVTTGSAKNKAKHNIFSKGKDPSCKN